MTGKIGLKLPWIHKKRDYFDPMPQPLVDRESVIAKCNALFVDRLGLGKAQKTSAPPLVPKKRTVIRVREEGEPMVTGGQCRPWQKAFYRPVPKILSARDKWYRSRTQRFVPLPPAPAPLPPPLPALPPKQPPLPPKEFFNSAWVPARDHATLALQQELLSKRSLVIHAQDNANTIFVASDVNNAVAIKTVLLSESMHDVKKNSFEIHVVDGEAHLKEITLQPSVHTIVILTNNYHYNLSAKEAVIGAVRHFLHQELIVKIAMPKGGDNCCDLILHDIIHSNGGISKGAKMIRSAVQIENVEALGRADEPLRSLPRKSLDQKKIVQDPPSSPRESLESRVKSAVDTYSKASLVTTGNIVEVNLRLRGITVPLPANFRAIMLRHPDLSDEENRKAFDSKDRRLSLMEGIKKSTSLVGKVAEYNHDYWVVVHDSRSQSPTGTVVTLAMRRGIDKLDIFLNAQTLMINNQIVKNPDTAVVMRTFRLYARLIPYYNEASVLTGIERTFFGPDAGKLNLQNSKGKNWKNKLARGVTSGSFAIMYDTKNPEYDIRGEGSENVLSALEVLSRQSSVAQQLKVSIGNEISNCRLSASLGVNDLVRMPLDARTKTLIILADNDGYNVETHQTLIDTVECFLTKGLVVKMALPIAKTLGQKIDLNDVLVNEGPKAAGEVLCRAVQLKHKKDLGSAQEPLQLHFLRLSLKDQLTRALPKEKCTLLFELGNICFQLKRYEEALDCYEESLQLLPAEAKQLSARLLHAIGNAQSRKGNYETALDYYEQSLSTTLQTSSNRECLEVARTLLEIGTVYRQQDDLNTALTYYTESIRIARLERSHKGVSSALYELGNLYFQWKEYPKALNYYRYSMRIKRRVLRTEYHLEIAEILSKIGDVHLRQRACGSALECYQDTVRIKQKVLCTERYGLDATLLLKMAKAYFLSEKYVSALGYYARSFTSEESAPVLSSTLKLLMQRADVIVKQRKSEKEDAPRRSSFLDPPPLPASLLIKPSVVEKQQETKQSSGSISLPSGKKRAISVLPTSSAQTLSLLRKNAYRIRQVALDVEATGGGVAAGHRLTEIGCVEIIDLKVTGSSFQAYVNPEREVSSVAYKLTGLTWKFLRNFPLFKDVSADFLQFIKGAELIFHNSDFDTELINYELSLTKSPYGLLEQRHKVTDTFLLAQQMYPGQKNGLDALCARYKIDTSKREKHGALIDAELLAEVYVAMLAGEIGFDGDKLRSGIFQKI